MTVQGMRRIVVVEAAAVGLEIKLRRGRLALAESGSEFVGARRFGLLDVLGRQHQVCVGPEFGDDLPVERTGAVVAG